MISKRETITMILPSPPNSKPMLSLMGPNGNAAEINKERSVLIEKIDWASNGPRKSSNPMTYFDFVFTKILRYTAMSPIKKNTQIQTMITPSAGKMI